MAATQNGQTEEAHRMVLALLDPYQKGQVNRPEFRECYQRMLFHYYYYYY